MKTAREWALLFDPRCDEGCGLEDLFRAAITEAYSDGVRSTLEVVPLASCPRRPRGGEGEVTCVVCKVELTTHKVYDHEHSPIGGTALIHEHRRHCPQCGLVYEPVPCRSCEQERRWEEKRRSDAEAERVLMEQLFADATPRKRPAGKGE